MFPGQGEFDKYHPGWGRENDNLCYSVMAGLKAFYPLPYLRTHKNYYYRITTHVKHSARHNRATRVNIFFLPLGPDWWLCRLLPSLLCLHCRRHNQRKENTKDGFPWWPLPRRVLHRWIWSKMKLIFGWNMYRTSLKRVNSQKTLFSCSWCDAVPWTNKL